MPARTDTERHLSYVGSIGPFHFRTPSIKNMLLDAKPSPYSLIFYSLLVIGGLFYNLSLGTLGKYVAKVYRTRNRCGMDSQKTILFKQHVIAFLFLLFSSDGNAVVLSNVSNSY